jgi:hypothetical protein
VHGVALDVDVVDRALVVLDVAAQLLRAGADDVLRVREPEGDEQQPRLVDVPSVLVDDGDPRLVGSVCTPEPVCDERAAGAATQDDDAVTHRVLPSLSRVEHARRGVRPGRSTRRGESHVGTSSPGLVG